MTDPRLIALSSNPGQVEPGPFSEHDLSEQWNAQADEFNQWESLDSSEQLAWAQTRAINSGQFASLTQELTAPIAWCRSDDFRNSLIKRQSFNGWREQHPDCDMALYAQPQASAAQSAPDADQAEGPSLADVDQLCREFGFHYADGETWVLGYDDTLAVLRDMIAVAITRWPPVAQAVARPVDLAALHDPDFSDGLTASQHLDVLRGGPDPRVTATPAPEEPETERVLRLAEIIREADGGNRLGAAALAEAILAHPGFSGCHDGPADLPAPDHVNLIGFAFGREPWATWLRQGGCLESAHCELSDLMLAVLAKWGRPAALPAQEEMKELLEFLDGVAGRLPPDLRHTAELLKRLPALPAPEFQIGPQEYIPHA